MKDADITKMSNVELFPEPDPDLFNIFSQPSESYTQKAWVIDTMKFQLHLPDENDNFGTVIPSSNHSAMLETQVNCTIIYLPNCIPMNKCKENCNSIGANAFRWFHNACCECIGQCDLAPYGDENAKCAHCSGTGKTDANDKDANEGMQSDESYGEDEEPSNGYE